MTALVKASPCRVLFTEQEAFCSVQRELERARRRRRGRRGRQGQPLGVVLRILTLGSW